MCSLVSILYTFYITFFRIYYVKNPLSKNQEKLRGRKVSDMAIEELKSWIEACNRMEKWVSYNKARRSWTQSRMEAETELEKRINET